MSNPCSFQIERKPAQICDHTRAMLALILMHMGRSEAPLSRDQREETLGETNRKPLLPCLSKSSEKRETIGTVRDEKFHGVESKSNKQDPFIRVTQFRLLFFQSHLENKTNAQ